MTEWTITIDFAGLMIITGGILLAFLVGWIVGATGVEIRYLRKKDTWTPIAKRLAELNKELDDIVH